MAPPPFQRGRGIQTLGGGTVPLPPGAPRCFAGPLQTQSHLAANTLSYHNLKKIYPSAASGLIAPHSTRASLNASFT